MVSNSSRARLRWLQPLALGAALLAPSVAFAADVKFGAAPLAVDDAGKITSEGNAAASTTLKSVPGEEVWNLNLWAKLDKGGPGPLYIEFLGKAPGGKTYVTYRHEYAEYQGEKYVSLSFELEGNLGFNKGKTYTVKVLQAAPKGKKDIVLASSKLTLEYVEPPPSEDSGEDEDEDDTAAQDEFDTLAGPDDDGDADPEAGPPAVAPASSKKGCSVGGQGLGFSGFVVLFALGFARRRRD